MEGVFGLRVKTEREMEIRISEKEILGGDISQIKTIIEKFAPDSRLSAENENNIVIKFDKLSSFDLSLKLQDPKYKAWFKKLDSEFPYIPFFLNKQSKTLMFFVMGNIDFTIDDHNDLHFNETSRKHYIINRIPSIKKFCINHNIDPRSAMRNLNSFEPTAQRVAPQKIRIEELLRKHGSVAYMSEQREYVISILIKRIPQDIKIHGTYYTEKNCPQPFFTVFMEEDSEKMQYTVFSQVSQRDTEEYLMIKPLANLIIAFEDNKQLSAFPKISTKVTIATLEQLEEQKTVFFSEHEEPKQTENEEKPKPEPEPETPAPEEPKEAEKHDPAEELKEIPDENEKPDQPEDPDKTLPVSDIEQTQEVPEKIEKRVAEPEEPEEAAPQNETLEEKVIRLEKEVARLREKTASQKKIIEDLEEEINKKRSFGSIFKGLFK